MIAARNKNTESIPVHRIAVVRPFTRLLADVGTPVERGFRQADLPWHALEDVNNYIPSHSFWKFLVSMSHSEGIADLGFRVGKRYGADCADPQMTALLKQAPTLYQGLLKASERVNRTITHCRIGIAQPADGTTSYFYHSPSCNADNPVIQQIGWFGITTLIGIVRVYTGPHWQPAEIGLMTEHSPCPYIREHFPRTRMRLAQTASYITLSNAELSLPPLHDEANIAAASSLDYATAPDDFVNSLEQILLSYLQEGDLSIELAAALCNTSKRTLQRRLNSKGTHYSEVLGNARFRAASQMLQSPGMSATDVACRLGYSDGAHFARAFRRIAGVSPREYMQQIQE